MVTPDTKNETFVPMIFVIIPVMVLFALYVTVMISSRLNWFK